MFGHQSPAVSGWVIIDGKEAGETLQCVHCCCHWLRRPGSGTVRGFCLSCGGPVCGGPKCRACVPAEAKVEMREAQEQEKEKVIGRLLSQYPDLPLFGL